LNAKKVSIFGNFAFNSTKETRSSGLWGSESSFETQRLKEASQFRRCILRNTRHAATNC
jgi:hypothetical protein